MKYFFCCILFIISCSTTTEAIHNDGLIGSWNYASRSEDGTETFTSSSKLSGENSGIQFSKNMQFVERMNMGWCGTPPAALENNSGYWIENSPKKLVVSVKYWGGVQNYNVEIISLTETELVIKRTYLYNGE